MSGLSRDARRLIEASRPRDRPPPGTRTRVKAAVDARVAAPALTGSAVVAKSGVFAKVVAVAALATGLGTIRDASTGSPPARATAVVSTRTSVARPIPRPRVIAPVALPATPPAVPPAVPEASVRVAPAVAVLAPVRTSSPSPVRPVSGPRIVERESVASEPLAPAPDRTSIAEELQLLARAQDALRTNNPAVCLVRLRAYTRAFPEGALREEALGMQGIARCMVGDQEGARAVERELRATSPRSPLLARLQTSCAGGASDATP